MSIVKKSMIAIASISLILTNLTLAANPVQKIKLAVINNSNYRIMIIPRLEQNAFFILDSADKKEISLNQEEDRFVAICWGANPLSSDCIGDFNDPIKVCYSPIKIIVTGDIAKKNLKVDCFDRNW